MNKKNYSDFKILIITQDDPFYIKEFFDEFLKNYHDHSEISGIVICSTMGKKSKYKLIKQMYNFYGLLDFTRMTFRYSLIKVKGNSLENLFNLYKIPVFRANNVNSDDFINYWKKQGITVLVSIAAPQIFKINLLNLPEWGCINIHSGKLPNYRGMMPNFWQMFHNEKSIGITVHTMDEKIDRGKYVLQQDVNIDPNESLDSLIKRTKRLGAHNIIEVLKQIKEGNISYLPASNEKGSYYTFPTKKEVKEFRKKRKKIL